MILALLAAAVLAPQDSAAFVTRLGADTLAVERFVYDRGRLTAEVVTRVPRTTRATYAVEPGAELPFVELAQWPFEVALRRLRATGTRAADVVLRTGERATPFPFAFLGADSATITHPLRGTMRARIDGVGRILALDAGATTRKLFAERRPWVDLDALAARWTAADAAGRGVGALSGRGGGTTTVHGVTITLDYGTPAKRGRAIWGALVPYGQLWRTGANAASGFTTDRDLVLGTGDQALAVPAGSYTLFSIPERDGGVLIVNRQTGQAGTAYDATQDLGRVALRARPLATPVEVFTILATEDAGGGLLRLQWDGTELVVPFAVAPRSPGVQAPDPRALERDLLRQLIAINTSDSARHTREAAEAMAARLIEAGLPAADVRVIETTPGYANLVARYRGRAGGPRPILLMAHLDVVDARREDWSFPPYELREVDGYYYGRGTSDNKAGAATLVAAFIRYRREGFVPARDLIMVLTGDEETTSDGISGLLERHRELVDAEYALNTDAGGGELQDGKPVAFGVQTAEKVYLSFLLEVRNRGGHSSVPEADNAIYRLAAGLGRVARYRFPVRLNETTRASFRQGAATQPRQLAADMRAVASRGDTAAVRRLSAAAPYYNAQLRTTCVATRLFAGHADNALPQMARATVNCRLLPDHPPDSAEATLRRVLADTAIKVSRVSEPTLSPPSPLRPDVMGPIERLVARMWPGAVIVPEMSTGATDGLYVRNAGIPVYGVSAVFERIDDVRAHGRDERIGIKAFHEAAEFWYELVKALSAGSARPS